MISKPAQFFEYPTRIRKPAKPRKASNLNLVSGNKHQNYRPEKMHQWHFNAVMPVALKVFELVFQVIAQKPKQPVVVFLTESPEVQKIVVTGGNKFIGQADSNDKIEPAVRVMPKIV